MGIAHPAFPHEINKVWEVVEPEPTAVTQLLWALGLIPIPVSDHWSFVLDLLFPYARRRLDVACGSGEPRFPAALRVLRQEHEEEKRAGAELPGFGDGAPWAHWLMDRDRKSTGLKILQGILWEDGYRAGELLAGVGLPGEPAVKGWVAWTYGDRQPALRLEIGLIAAITWNLLTWWFGIPSSSSHTLLGGFAGAAVANAGFGVVNQEKLLITFSFIFAAPIIGMIVASIITLIIVNICKRSNRSKADRWFKRLQLVSSALFSIGHGGNDAQKVMGIIAAAMLVYMAQLNAAGEAIPDWANIGQEVNSKGKLVINHLPYWIPVACYLVLVWVPCLVVGKLSKPGEPKLPK